MSTKPLDPREALYRLVDQTLWTAGNDVGVLSAIADAEAVRSELDRLDEVRALIDNPKDAHYPVVLRSDVRAAMTASSKDDGPDTAEGPQ